MLKIAVAVVVGGALVVCVSDPASARLRLRVSTPAKAAIVQPAKPLAVQPPKAAAAAATTSRPSVGVFVPLRPFAAAPRDASPQRAVPALAEQAGTGDIGTAAAGSVASAPVALHAAHGSAKDQEPAKAPAAATPSTAEPAKARPAPGFAPARLASTSVHVVNHKAQPARTPVYCYVQPSGACVPF
jgi:hypothetical protein